MARVRVEIYYWNNGKSKNATGTTLSHSSIIKGSELSVLDYLKKHACYRLYDNIELAQIKWL